MEKISIYICYKKEILLLVMMMNTKLNILKFIRMIYEIVYDLKQNINFLLVSLLFLK